MDEASTSRYVVVPLSVSTSDLDDVIALGDASRSTLGFLPRAGYLEAARKDSIIVATRQDDNAVAGYCLYSVTLHYVRVIHVCVADGHRGEGLAARLLDTVQCRHPDVLGLKLKCRRDWPANYMWPHLGFQPVTDMPGRSRAGHPLTAWWRANRIPSLFDVDDDQSLAVLVSVDTNVFCDLHSRTSSARRQFSGPLAMLAADEQVRLALPASVASELNQTPNADERQHYLRTAATYIKLGSSRAEILQIASNVVSLLPSGAASSDPSLEKDILYVAESISDDARVFATRDANLIRIVGPIVFENYGILVLDPVEVPSHLAREKSLLDYQPARLAETAFNVTRPTAEVWAGVDIYQLLNRADGERRSSFTMRLRETAASPGDLERYTLVGPDGELVAAWAVGRTAGRLQVPLFRVRSGQLQTTIARQLILGWRQEAVRSGANAIVVDDAYVSRGLIGVLERDGFTSAAPARWSVAVIDLCSTWDCVRAAAEGIAQDSQQLPEAAPSIAQASELERVWWPAKILDSNIPCYFIPIKSSFADELLGHHVTLLERRSELGLSREHVYYRSSRSQPRAPGRLLWYSSKRDMEVVACSRLVDSTTSSAESLYRSFRSLGVWNLEQIRECSTDGRVGAIRFADTEVFENPISLRRLRELSVGSASLPSQGPVKITGALFAAIYAEGRRA